MRGPPETQRALLAERPRENLDQTNTPKINAQEDVEQVPAAVLLNAADCGVWYLVSKLKAAP